MRTADPITDSLRESESGKCWEEKLSNTTGTIQVSKTATVRVRCVTTGTTVTIGGVLAATMLAGEIIIFNAGDGDPDSTSTTVPVVIGAQAAFVQVAREAKRLKLAV